MPRAALALAPLWFAGALALHPGAQTLPRDSTSSSAATAEIRGRVTLADGDTPVRRARVTLTPESGAPPSLLYSDGDGRFAFSRLAPGRYALAAWKSGFVETTYGARTPWDPHMPVSVGSGETVSGLQIVLARSAAITGRVTDDEGDPLADMGVTIGRVVSTGRHSEFQPVGPAVTTDDLGEYRAGGLPPGTFVVAVNGWAPISPAAEASGRAPGFSPRLRLTFYPQAPSAARAKSIALKAGEEAAGIDVMLGAGSASTLLTVSGHIVDPSARGNGYLLAVETDADGIGAAAWGRRTFVPASGEFTFALPPGEYTIGAEMVRASGEPGGEFAYRHVSVDQSDIAGIELTIANGARISGRVVFDGAAARPPGRVLVEAVTTGLAERFARRTGVVAANGSFEIAHVIGEREIRVEPLPAGWSVASITAGGRNLADVPVTFKTGDDLRGVTIVLSTRTTELRGTVVDARQAPAPDASVIVFAADRRMLPRRARWVRPDQNGRFILSGLPAGDYLAIAVAEVDDTVWSTAAYLDRFRAAATPITLAGGERTSIALHPSEGR